MKIRAHIYSTEDDRMLDPNHVTVIGVRKTRNQISPQHDFPALTSCPHKNTVTNAIQEPFGIFYVKSKLKAEIH